jgi:hypothetical protein
MKIRKSHNQTENEIGRKADSAAAAPWIKRREVKPRIAGKGVEVPSTVGASLSSSDGAPGLIRAIEEMLSALAAPVLPSFQVGPREISKDIKEDGSAPDQAAVGDCVVAKREPEAP